MTQEYTPTEDDLINLIVAGMWRINRIGTTSILGSPRTVAQAVEAAKRCLAAHDAQIRAEAWDEGHTRGWMDGMENTEHTSSNPYRKENYLYKSSGLQREEQQQ